MDLTRYSTYSVLDLSEGKGSSTLAFVEFIKLNCTLFVWMVLSSTPSCTLNVIIKQVV